MAFGLASRDRQPARNALPFNNNNLQSLSLSIYRYHEIFSNGPIRNIFSRHEILYFVYILIISEILIPKKGEKMNLRLSTKKYLADSKIRFLRKSILKLFGPWAQSDSVRVEIRNAWFFLTSLWIQLNKTLWKNRSNSTPDEFRVINLF